MFDLTIGKFKTASRYAEANREFSEPEHIGEILRLVFENLWKNYGGCPKGLNGEPPLPGPPLGVARNERLDKIAPASPESPVL
jgi:hypothetical protein